MYHHSHATTRLQHHHGRSVGLKTPVSMKRMSRTIKRLTKTGIVSLGCVLTVGERITDIATKG
jgi:hypothetical protein